MVFELTSEQIRVYNWLNNDLNLPVFAEAYKGAIMMIRHKSNGYVSFVSHAARDIMNLLASTHIGVQSSTGRVDYVKHVSSIQNDWLEDWQYSSDFSIDPNTGGHLIPLRVCQKISLLIEDHTRGSERAELKAGIFFYTFLDYSDRDKIPKNYLTEWRKAKEWFNEHSHLRIGAFDEQTHTGLVTHFNCLDGYLYIAASSQYDRLKDLNEILDNTNQ